MNQEVHELELNIEEARSFITLAESLERLGKNQDFQKVVLEEYFKNEPVRLTEALSAPGLQEQKYQDAIVKSLSGIGQFQQFINKVNHQADLAKQSIHESEQALAEIEAEGSA